jgi:phosphatidate cytidylyltransferase
LDDDTGEIPIIGLGDADVEPAAESTVFDGEDFTEEHYLDAATREHHDLAAEIAVAESQDTEQVALSAAIPGLDAGVVGFDDVVAAHGDDTSAPVAPPKSSDLVLRVGTGVALVAAFLLSLLWRPAIIVLALAVFVIAAGEFYSVLMHRRYRPLSIFGFLGIVGAGLGSVVWGVVAIPLAFALMITVILLYDAVSQRRLGAVNGFALTILVAVWIGGFGAFAFPIIAADNYQALVLTIVGMVALVDIAAYFVGRTIGRRPFAPTISPKKTIEGFIGGTLMALLAGAVASFFVEAIDLPAGLVLGVVVAVFAPLGDLAVSVVKRSLDIKDMGSILPGHGGLLDRIDAIIAVIPAAWATFVWLGLL